MKKSKSLISEFLNNAPTRMEDDDYYPPIVKTNYVLSSGEYFLSEPTALEIPSGYYECIYANGRGPGLKPFPKPKCDEWIAVRDELFGKVFNDLSKFREARERYKKAGVSWKRGMILYGPPGTGKTMLALKIAMDTVENHNGICVKCTNAEMFTYWSKFAPIYRTISPEQPVILLLEEFDKYDSWVYPTVLETLDGSASIDNVVVIATCNEIMSLPSTLKDRPGRIDRIYFIGTPLPEDRRIYIEHFNKSWETDFDVELLVSITKDLSIAHLKEVLISATIMGTTPEHEIAQFNENKIAKRADGSHKSIGYGK